MVCTDMQITVESLLNDKFTLTGKQRFTPWVCGKIRISNRCATWGCVWVTPAARRGFGGESRHQARRRVLAAAVPRR